MDFDMTKYIALLQAAKVEQDSGDLKSAYATYLKAHASIMRILGAQITFKDKDSLESAPDNYTQLFAHAQEILRRVKDIVNQSKTPDTKPLIRSTSSISIASRQHKSSALTSPSTNARPGLTSSQPSQRSITTISQLNKRTKKNIPMIPISPLTRQALLHSYALSQVTQRFEQAKQGSSSQGSPSPSRARDLASLRRLIEDVRIQRAKLDAVNVQIHSVSTSNITSWDPDMIARQITVIDTQLFKDVAIPKDLTRSDRKASAAQRCIDFETYVAHSIAHLLLLEWNASRQQSPINSPASSKSHAPAPSNAVNHMIRVANILLNVYRNFNGFMAVMRALTSPEIKRMHKSWSGITSKTKDTFKKLVQIYQAQDGTRCYRGALIQKLDAFQDVGKDAVVAIPWMRYHIDEVKSIINSYLTGHESTGGSSDIVLSAPGARKLSAVSTLLMQCRTNDHGGFDRQDGDNKPQQSSMNAKHRETIQIEGLKIPLTPILDLASLGTGDIALHHWLLSRPFLNKQQLIDESLEIEPLFHGEELPCYDAPFENEDSEDSVSVTEDLAHEDSFEHVIAPEHDLEPLPESTRLRSQSRPSLARAPVSETEISDIMNELLNDNVSDSKGLFDDIGTAGSDGDTTDLDQNRLASRSPERSHDVLQFLGINPEDCSDSDNSDDQGGDITKQSALHDKGKGKAVEDDNTEDIDSLLARVKGLVRESRSHTEELDSIQVSSGYDLDEQIDIGMDEQVTSSGRKFEPFQQGSEEDQFDFDNDNVNSLKSADLFTPGTTEGSSMLSLEALRRQLQDMDQGSETTPETAKNGANHESVDKGEPKHTDASLDSVHSAHPEEISKDQTSNESNQDILQESVAKSESASPPTSLSASANPFAPYAIKKTSTESSLSTSPNISKGRRRKIQTDRTGRTDNLADSSESGKITTGFSPPRLHNNATTGGPEMTLEAIAARAKMSLASHGEKKPSINSLASPSLSTTEVVKSETYSEKSMTTKEEELVDLTTAGSESLAYTPVVSIQELDKLAALFQNIDVKFTIHIDDSDESGGDDYDYDQFSCRSTRSIESPGASVSEVDDRTKIEEALSYQTNATASNLSNSEEFGNDEPASTEAGVTDKSPVGEPADGPADRSNRQRRRKAGGVINVPAPPKSLLSKMSTSSLSGTFNDERVRGHGREQEQQLKQGLDQLKSRDNAQEVGRHSSADASTTSVNRPEPLDSSQEPHHTGNDEIIVTNDPASKGGDAMTEAKPTDSEVNVTVSLSSLNDVATESTNAATATTVISDHD
ncbi:hypothetical protein BGX27_000094 [Mortierella sp. AM989]|nr:hypothetical protein BGX27_000094 [Mortierella sp. AM989]